ncbi:protein NUCLEAR FUSION DEFECTIVE 4 isoform X1 [Selaginella moellendorffii]|uniref:protein NUCLEAR FUSION DEFECTIVE 4 isoform X1 n=2 Tax=Selaginella moellendorffii TaxID=88036 RepID=UPI000D1CF9F8|nr:protein NUCLEAR FUSION DEFECTIVE 4 isoform X1 [Selaginella moellendorffii]|eukprot:XP_024526536.1 protein NUCLEAR FUSION DEFECTIVE 4 isoform X1 [Selaginella moellendorffii]
MASISSGPSSQLTIKWLGLAASIWIQAFAGNAYTFSHFSPRLKAVLHYSQIELNNLGVAKDIGENVGLITGYLSNKLPAWLILFIGGLEAFLGYGVLWLVVSERIAPLPYWQMCLAICIGANSATFFNTAVLVTTMRNFPQSRGTVVGILKGFVGLSGAIFTQLYTSFLFKNPVSLLLLLSTSPFAVSVACMGFVRPVPDATREPEEKRNFFLVHVICVSLALYLLVATFVQDFLPSNPIVSGVIATVMLLFLFAPVFVALKFFILGLFKRTEEPPSRRNLEQEDGGVGEPLVREETVQFQIGSTEEELGQSDEEDARTLPTFRHDDSYIERTEEELSWDDRKKFPPGMSTSDSATSLSEADIENDTDVLMAVGEGAVSRKRKPRRGEDFNLRQSLLKADFWLLFFTFFCGVGSGVTAINNLGQIGQAQGFTDVTIFVTLLGIWNFLGRLGGGAISEKYVRKAVPRTLWLAGAQCLMVVAHLLFAWAGTSSLHVGSILLGFCYGVHFSVMVPTASELFGLKHFGKIYNFLTMGDPVGSLLFSGVIAGYLYDMEARDGPQADQCIGAHCFRLTFLIMAGVCLVGSAASVYVSVRIKPVYQSLYKSGRAVRNLH